MIRGGDHNPRWSTSSAGQNRGQGSSLSQRTTHPMTILVRINIKRG